MSRIIVTLLLVVGLLIGIYLVSQQTNLFPKADITNAPQEIKISNISDNSFTVSWITFKPVSGFIKYGTSEQLGETAVDDRDSGIQTARTTHHVTLKNLQPAQTYFYAIASGVESFDNKGQSFQHTTAPSTENPLAVPQPLFGKVTQQDGQTPAEALVYLETQDGSLLSSYTRSDGNWLITLNNARTKDLSNYLVVKDSDPVSLTVESWAGDQVEVKGQAGDGSAFARIVLSNSSPKVRDLNGDGKVNVFDYILLLLGRK